MAGLVYTVIAIVVKFVGVAWINKLMPAAVIGPTVALIGLSLASAAVNDVFSYGETVQFGLSNYFVMKPSAWVSLTCALVALVVIILCSVYGKKMAKLIPFILGVLAGYGVGLVFTLIGIATKNADLMIIDFAPFKALVADGVNLSTFVALPEFSFVKALEGAKEFEWSYLATVAVAYIPVAFVVFAEHIADHKNLSSIIEEDLLENPGLHRTLLGDGIGSMAGAFFGGCPNTTYGESVGCVAITRNASIATITTTAIMAILISFVSPFVAFLDSIPGCVMGGVCITLYGFIAVSGLKMLQPVDLGDNRNLFVVAAILVCGIGGLTLKLGPIEISAIATALVLGIIVNVIFNRRENEKA
jgi:uracil permease